MPVTASLEELARRAAEAEACRERFRRDYPPPPTPFPEMLEWLARRAA